MRQQPTTAPIIESEFYALQGKTIIAILETMKNTLPCAFINTVVAVENMLAQAQAITLNPAANPLEQEVNSRSAPVVPASTGNVENYLHQ